MVAVSDKYGELNRDLKEQEALRKPKKIKEKRPPKKIPKYKEGCRKKVGGVKSTYKDEYIKLLLEHMSMGLSFEGFPGTIGVNPNTVYEWCHKYPQFGEAKAIGQSLARDFWDKLKVDKCVTGDPTHSSLINSTYKNRFAWKDRHELALPDLSEEEVEDLARDLLE